MRLIDADALADALFDKHKDYPQWVADTIGNMPIIDSDVLLQQQERVEPRLSIEDRCYYCGKCEETEIMTYYNYCPNCGRAVKWND